SVVRAGLVPAIWSGAHGLARNRDWKVVIMTPGAHPLEELAVRIATERGVSPGSVLEDLRGEPHNFCLAVRQLLRDPSPDARLEAAVRSRTPDGRGDEPGGLPLLSHALLETWTRRQDHTMSVQSYVESGGVRGAIARTADAVYERLEPEQQEVAKRIFLRLAEPGRGTEYTRRRASLSELLPGGEEQEAVEEVLDILARARLVTVGLDAV